MAANKIFVCNFSFTITEDQLRDYFSKVGNVTSVKVIKHGQGGKSRGFGFVEFAAPDDARKAISELNDSNWEGRVIKVSEDRTDRKGDGQPGGQTQSGFASPGGRQAQANAAPLGYFRAQPLDLGLKRKRKPDVFLENEELSIDYKNPKQLIKFMSERGKILPRRMTGLTAKHQRYITRAIKRAQYLALLPYTRGA